MTISFKEFDQKLAECLEKIRTKEGLDNRDEIAAIYQRSAVNLRGLIEKYNDTVLLGLANQTFEHLLNEQSNDAVNEKLLKRAEVYGKQAKLHAASQGAHSFSAVATLVASLVFAIPTGGLSLIGLLYTADAGVSAYLKRQAFVKASERAKDHASFVESNRSLSSIDNVADNKQPQGKAFQKTYRSLLSSDKASENTLEQGDDGEQSVGSSKKMD